jgi:hypothetical protein
MVIMEGLRGGNLTANVSEEIIALGIDERMELLVLTA